MVAERDVNDLRSSSVLQRALPGRVFSALELGCVMYAGFERSSRGWMSGVDLGEEWRMAERLADDTLNAN